MTLEEATRALREEGAMDAARKRAIRERVLVTPRKRPLFRAARWVMPIAAVLAAASVWAAVAHNRAPAPSAPVVPTATAVMTVPAPIVTATATPAPTTTSEVTSEIEPPKVVPTTTPKPPAPRDDSERMALRAYREAERLQFDEKDYARALEAWDRYIPLAGTSPLLVDAKWQRALCLVRLGRPEAREAIAPFARGELGAYRQDEARTILDTLR